MFFQENKLGLWSTAGEIFILKHLADSQPATYPLILRRGKTKKTPWPAFFNRSTFG